MERRGRRGFVPSQVMLVLLGVIVLAVAAIAVAVNLNYKRVYGTAQIVPYAMEIQPDLNARAGELDPQDNSAQVEPNNYRVIINQMPTMEDGGSRCNLDIENARGNRYLAQVRILLNESGETLFESPVLEPGQGVTDVQFAVRLEQGEHPCTAEYTLYDPQTREESGALSVNLTVRVLA